MQPVTNWSGAVRATERAQLCETIADMAEEEGADFYYLDDKTRFKSKLFQLITNYEEGN